MKIAIICNFDKEITDESTGGTEVFSYNLINFLSKSKKISKIYVFGVGKNHFYNKKIFFNSLIPNSSYSYINNNEILKKLNSERSDFFSEFRFNLAIKTFKKIFKIINQVDIIHDNSTSALFSSLDYLFNKPIVTTLHTNFESPAFIIPYNLGLITNKKHYFVVIAKHQLNFFKKNLNNIKNFKVIYNGININKYPFKLKPQDDYGIWIGRISRKHNKGIIETILFSKLTKKKVKILASLDDLVYYKDKIENLLINEKQIDFITNKISLNEKIKYYQNAKYFIYPIIWEEPFGLVFIEAMATGTPVVAFARGSVPEIIKDGETGFIVNPSDNDIRGNWIIKKTGIEGLCQAVERIYSMPENEYRQMRYNCRKHVEQNFTAEKMVDEYEKVYQEILAKQK